MTIKPIKTEADYQQALARLEIIFDSKKNTTQGDELEILGILIESYENENFPMGFPDPIEAIKFRMEQLGYNQADLAKVVGLKSRASEILNKKRKLSLEYDSAITPDVKNSDGSANSALLNPGLKIRHFPK